MFQLENFILKTEVLFPNESIETTKWDLSYHYKFGPCLYLDTRNIQSPIKGQLASQITIKWNLNFPWKDLLVFMFEKGKFSNEWLYQTWAYLPKVSKDKEYYITLKKKIIEKSMPCVPYPKFFCNDLAIRAELKEKYHCHVPLMKSYELGANILTERV